MESEIYYGNSSS